MAEVEDRLAAAKLWVISERTSTPNGPRGLAYLASSLYQMATVVTAEVLTMTVDERWRVYVNPEWAMRTPIDEIGRELAHLAWHLLMDHSNRARSMGVNKQTAKIWHMATDLTIYDTLDKEGACPADVCAASEQLREQKTGVRRKGMSSEEYYTVLSGLPVTSPNQQTSGNTGGDSGWGEGLCGSGCDGLPRHTDLPADADIGSIDKIDAENIRHHVAIEYREHMKGMGDLPGEALRWANSITDPVIPWQPLLARAVRHGVGWASGRVEPTWTRPSRRQSVTPEFPQPGWRRPVPNIAMVIDTSGSIDDVLLGQAQAEVEGALTALGIPGAAVAVYSCDAAAYTAGLVRKAGDIEFIGGGGTDMRVGIAAAADARPRPDLIVVLTDGYTPWPKTPPPGSAVIIAILRRPEEDCPATPSWATRIDCVLGS